MSDVVWYAITVILFAGSLACLFYSGWQVLCPMRLRRVRVIWLTSQHFRARADVWYWRTVFLLAAVSCMGIAFTIAARLTNHSALSSFGTIVILIGDFFAVVGVAIVAYYERQARNARRRELESAAVR